jgi:hypothetical protein
VAPSPPLPCPNITSTLGKGVRFMTDRDWYGLAAMMGLLAAGKTGSHRSLAAQAWAYADALLDARDQSDKPPPRRPFPDGPAG